MAKLIWDNVAERGYEAGVSKGVLYSNSGDGAVAWNGLVSISESSQNQDKTVAYFDGVTYINSAMNGYYQASVSSLGLPIEFHECLGEEQIVPGVLISNQKRTRFGFCYRTEMNDGYKLHLVYDASMYRNNVSHVTNGDGVATELLELTIVVNTSDVLGAIRNTGAYILDSTSTPAEVMASIEMSLYGISHDGPRLPSPSEILTIFSAN